jgi:hypothetical protein
MKDKNKIKFTNKEIKEMYKGLLPKYEYKILEIKDE